MKLGRIAAGTSTALLAVTTVGAAHASPFDCNYPVTVDLGMVYVDVRDVLGDRDYSIWTFAESGVAPGLQRGGSHVAFQATGNEDVAGMIGWTDTDCVRTSASDHILL